MWRKVHALERQVSAADLDTFRSSVSTFQANAAKHLEALTEGLATTAGRAETAVSQTTELAARLYAAPYMNGEERFYYTDAGRRVMGFRSGRGTSDDLYVGFEDIFRGGEAFIRDRMKAYLPILTKHARVVEIGPGRGEMLDLLRDAGVPAIGVDTDEGMVRRCRSRGHEVEHADGIGFLRARPDSSLPAIFCAQVVEHLGYDDFLTFLRLSLAKLAPGGQLVFETVNPHALEAFKTFYTDLTHQRPIFPEVALAWCWLTGFAEGYVAFPTGEGDLEGDRRTRGEYAVVATKGSATDSEGP
jgi:SAM-dependent methyltransferase